MLNSKNILILILVIIIGILSYKLIANAPSGTQKIPIDSATSFTDLLERNSNIACGDTLPDEGKEIIISGYGYSSDLKNVINPKRDGSANNQFIIRGDKDTASSTISVTIASNREKIVNELIHNYNTSGNYLTELSLTGKIQGFDMPIMGHCLVGISLNISDLSVIK